MTNPGRWGRDRKVSRERLRRVKYLDGLGWTARQIADELGLTARTVRAYRRRAREGWVPTTGRPVQVEADAAAVAKVRDLYTSGMSQTEVGRVFGVSRSWVEQVMQSNGIPTRGSGAAARAGWVTRRRNAVSQLPESTSASGPHVI